MSIPDKYKVDHLILLVGGNPLPNAVAGRLLVVADKGHISLICSKQTEASAKKLRQWFIKTKVAQTVHEPRIVDESDGFSIRTAINGILKDEINNDNIKIGLNYTGGTKAMATHSYSALWFLSDRSKQNYVQRPNVQISYLDARNLEMVIEKFPQEPKRIPTIRLDPLKFTLEELVSWHTEHNLSKLTSRSEWKEKYKPQLETRDWISEAKCKSDNDSKGFGEENKGDWLEDFTLYALQEANEKYNLGFDKTYIRVKTVKSVSFEMELDVVGIRGYQLFVFSCAARNDAQSLKLKLFEAYERAKQLGGDEARAALVCLAKSTKQNLSEKTASDLEREMSAILAPNIKVFGRDDLDQLVDKIAEWVNAPKG